MRLILFSIFTIALFAACSTCFSPSRRIRQAPPRYGEFRITARAADYDSETSMKETIEAKQESPAMDRRAAINKAGMTLGGLAVVSLLPPSKPANAAVGSLPEFSDTNAILQGVTVKVADQSQQESMIKFLIDSFDFKVLRQRKSGSITDTWLGFGPEQLSIPSAFTIPVSSFAEYGGHASIHIRYDSQDTNVYYRSGETAPGDNIAYLQVGVPTYRISQMVQNGGNVLDAYGIVNVVSPCGLPMRGIVGVSPDPIMFVAISCANVEQSRLYYEQLGFVEQDYPFCRPNKGAGPFEPPQPPKSVYLAPSKNSMGILLLPTKSKKQKVTRNPVLESLNIVYTPSDNPAADLVVKDPSGISIAFQSVDQFEKEEQASRIGKQRPMVIG